MGEVTHLCINFRRCRGSVEGDDLVCEQCHEDTQILYEASIFLLSEEEVASQKEAVAEITPLKAGTLSDRPSDTED